MLKGTLVFTGVVVDTLKLRLIGPLLAQNISCIMVAILLCPKRSDLPWLKYFFAGLIGKFELLAACLDVIRIQNERKGVHLGKRLRNGSLLVDLVHVEVVTYIKLREVDAQVVEQRVLLLLDLVEHVLCIFFLHLLQLVLQPLLLLLKRLDQRQTLFNVSVVRKRSARHLLADPGHTPVLEQEGRREVRRVHVVLRAGVVQGSLGLVLSHQRLAAIHL